MNSAPVAEEAALWAIRFLLGREPRDGAEIATLQRLPHIARMRAELLCDGPPPRFTFAAPVDSATITWAFTMILGRPPESAAVVAQHAALPTVAALAQALFASAEFQQNGGPWLRLMLEGQPHRFTGHPDDTYHQHLPAAAAETEQIAHIATAVARARGRPMQIVDIGANLGLTAALLAPRASRLLAIEPNPATADHLEFNLRLNGLTNVTIARTALGEGEGDIAFQADAFSAGSHIANDSFNKPSITVPLTTLDSLAAAHGFDDIGFIKLDVEGYERQVLQGAAATIARCRPVIFAEFNTWALIAMGDTQPMRFLRDLLQSFPQLYAIEEDAPLRLRQLQWQDLTDILYRNMFHRGCLENLILSHDNAWVEQLA